MKAYLLIDLIIFFNIYCGVWAQTLNNETTTQIPGNTEPLALEMTQTPKTDDNQTEYESITTTPQSNDFDSNNQNSEDLVSMNNTFVVTTVTQKSVEFTESHIQGMESQTTTPPVLSDIQTDQENQRAIGSGNSTSKSIEGIDEQTSDSLTTNSPVMNVNEVNDSRATPQPLVTNITSVFIELLEKTSKSPNLSDDSRDETNDFLNSISDVNETRVKTMNTSEEPYYSSTDSSHINDLRGVTTITHNSTQNSQHLSSFSPEMTEKTRFIEIDSRQTIETSTHKPSVDTTLGIQSTTIKAYIESSSNSSNRLNTQESPQITEIPIKSTESQTVANHYYFPETSVNPINQNTTQYPEFSQNSYLNASEISSSAQVETQTPEVHTIPKVSTIITVNTSSEAPNPTTLAEVMQTNEQKESETTEPIPQTESERLTTTTISETIHSFRETQSPRQSKAQSIETEPKPLIELLSTTSTVSQPKERTQSQSQSTQTLSSTEVITNEKPTASPTQHSQSPELQTQNQITESSVGVQSINNSEPSVDSQTTFNLPLTDRQTPNQKPMTTSIPFESNISAITVTLPNIKYIESISKEDMLNIVTITFVANSLDILRWVSVFDKMFRNHTCNRIDSERNWCTIDRFVYLSPSPLIDNNHLILNFLIDDSTDNDLNGFHVFAGPLIVEALKNSTKSLETMIGMKVMSLQTNLGTIIVKELSQSPERLAKFEFLILIFTVVMFICTALLCLAVICSCAKRKSVDMNQIQLSNAGRRHTATNGGFDLNSASNILRDENQENKINHNVINVDGWVAPMDQVDSKQISKYDNLQDTKL